LFRAELHTIPCWIKTQFRLLSELSDHSSSNYDPNAPAEWGRIVEFLLNPTANLARSRDDEASGIWCDGLAFILDNRFHREYRADPWNSNRTGQGGRLLVSNSKIPRRLTIDGALT
jgi:hypothetical protein